MWSVLALNRTFFLLDSLSIVAKQRGGRRGMSLVEIMVAMAILAIITVGLVISFFSTSHTNELTIQETQANNAAQQAIEDVIGMTKRYGSYLNGYGVTWERTPCRAIFLDAMLAHYLHRDANRFFTIEGLDAMPEDPAPGEIIFYLNENRIPVELGGSRTDAVEGTGREQGMWFGKMDLNGDGAFSDLSSPTIGGYTDRTGQYRRLTWRVNLVPVEVRIRWKSKKGEMMFRRFTLIARTFQ